MSRPVADIISACDTGLASGLSLQIIQKLNRMTKTPVLKEVKHALIIPVDAAVNLYLQPVAANALIIAAANRGADMWVNSMFRTVVQQHIIRRQYERGLCGITAAAMPGTSNHEKGGAIDLRDADDWEYAISEQGWTRLGQDYDWPHSDYWNIPRQDIPWLQIAAFQQLWNQYNPLSPIPIDGVYGPLTGQCIDKSPIDGWTELAKK